MATGEICMETEELLKNLNCDQRAAVLHDHTRNGPLLILAGAGSGKTSVLTRRILYRIAQGALPESILALTFTAKAAHEMDERVKKAFPGAGVRLCTFHSLALSLLRECVDGECNWKRLGFKRAPVPTEGATMFFANELVRSGLRADALPREKLFSKDLPARVSRKLSELRAGVFADGQVVFEDLIHLAIRLLEKEGPAQASARARFREVLVDEYQDIDPSQYRFVRAILGANRNLFVVGDDDQAIYGFRGADIGNILRFRSDFPDSALIRLEWNYRSVPQVLYLANRIFEHKALLFRKTLRAGNMNASPVFRENLPPELWVSGNPEQEMLRIIQKMKEMRMDYALPWKAFAVLVRYNRQRLYYEKALGNSGIPLFGEETEDSPAVDGVQVETVHGSKGLQYPVVFYAGLAEKLTPGECRGTRRVRKMQLSEERRLFYVGVTRAEARLFLLYCRKRHWKGRLTYFKPSRFLKCLPRPLPETFRMPLLFFRIQVVFRVLIYMISAVFALYFRRLFLPKTVEPWIEYKVQDFARFCLRVLRVDLIVENQALLARVDWSRPVVVVGNHQSYSDIPVVFAALSRTIGFLAKKQLGYIPCLRFWMLRLHCLFVDRESPRAARELYQKIDKEKSVPRVFIFPEGTRSRDGKVHEFKSGAFRFACDLNATLLPIAIKGSRACWENRRDLAVARVKAVVLEPVDIAAINPPPRPKQDLLPDVQKRILEALELA